LPPFPFLQEFQEAAKVVASGLLSLATSSSGMDAKFFIRFLPPSSSSSFSSLAEIPDAKIIGLFWHFPFPFLPRGISVVILISFLFPSSPPLSPSGKDPGCDGGTLGHDVYTPPFLFLREFYVEVIRGISGFTVFPPPLLLFFSFS